MCSSAVEIWGQRSNTTPPIQTTVALGCFVPRRARAQVGRQRGRYPAQALSLLLLTLRFARASETMKTSGCSSRFRQDVFVQAHRRSVPSTIIVDTKNPSAGHPQSSTICHVSRAHVAAESCFSCPVACRCSKRLACTGTDYQITNHEGAPSRRRVSKYVSMTAWRLSPIENRVPMIFPEKGNLVSIWLGAVWCRANVVSAARICNKNGATNPFEPLRLMTRLVMHRNRWFPTAKDRPVSAYQLVRGCIT
ncbi:hypothetical protein GGS20DRAFT_125750 [Poronia punctata]|nr:hypothetical protein GGS20DRAFT_125750 [Poronia punctata]